MNLDQLVLPAATLPNLVIRTSPVIVSHTYLDNVEDIVLKVVGDVVHCAESGEVPLSQVSLDLKYATGRTHAVWHLARLLKAPNPYNARWSKGVSVGLWRLTYLHPDGDHELFPFGQGAYYETPSLISDATLMLSDGTAYEDAEALRRVILYKNAK